MVYVWIQPPPPPPPPPILHFSMLCNLRVQDDLVRPCYKLWLRLTQYVFHSPLPNRCINFRYFVKNGFQDKRDRIQRNCQDFGHPWHNFTVPYKRPIKILIKSRFSKCHSCSMSYGDEPLACWKAECPPAFYSCRGPDINASTISNLRHRFKEFGITANWPYAPRPFPRTATFGFPISMVASDKPRQQLAWVRRHTRNECPV